MVGEGAEGGAGDLQQKKSEFGARDVFFSSSLLIVVSSSFFLLLSTHPLNCTWFDIQFFFTEVRFLVL